MVTTELYMTMLVALSQWLATGGREIVRRERWIRRLAAAYIALRVAQRRGFRNIQNNRYDGLIIPEYGPGYFANAYMREEFDRVWPL